MWCAFQSVNNRGIEMKTKMKKFPKTPFKLDCGDRPEVRQWVKDNGCVWVHSGCISENLLDKKYLIIDNDRLVTYSYSAESKEYQAFMQFNPFKKKSKLEKRVEALEEQVKSQVLPLAFPENVCEVVNFKCKFSGKKEEPKPVNFGWYRHDYNNRYYYINSTGYIVGDYMISDITDMYNLSIGNHYKTGREAEQALLRQQALVRVNDRIDELNSKVLECNTYYLITSITEDGFIDFINSNDKITASIFRNAYTAIILREVIINMNEDIKLAVGWEQ